MRSAPDFHPWWAALMVWGVVNAINVLQAAGFLSRVVTGGMAVNHVLGYVIVALALPSTVALVALIRVDAGPLHWVGPIVFLAFVALQVVLEYVWAVEFRSPVRPEILAPYLVLFFGAILTMGLPMFVLNRRLWLVTVATTSLLLLAMGLAMARGVG